MVIPQESVNPWPRDLRGMKGALILAALIALGMAGNHFKFMLSFGTDFIFGSIFAMLALQLFGVGRGIAASFIISSILFLGWGHHYALIIMTAEVAVVGWLHSRRRIGYIQADVLYWLFLGMPLIYLSYHLRMQVPQNSTLFIMLKDMVNGLANVLVARLLFTALEIRSPKSSLSYRELVYNLLAFFVLCPALIMLTNSGRAEYIAANRQIRRTLIQDSRRMSDRIEVWVVNRQSSIFNLAEMAASKTPQQMQPYLEQAKKSDSNFIRVGLRNREATVIASYPLIDEFGQSHLGRNFADRPYVPVIKQTLKPMLSEVVMDRIGSPKPLVALVAPIVVRGEYNGYVAGVLNLEQIRQHLDRSTNEKALLYTLLDRNGHIIMSNRGDLKAMAPFDRTQGTLKPLDGGLQQWTPVLPPHTPAIERWGKSFYVLESNIGQLSEWKLILEQPVAPFQKGLFERYLKDLALLLLLLLMSLAVAEVVSRRMTRSLVELSRLTQDLPIKLALGGPAIRWPESGIQESNRLITHFRLMASSLSEQFNKVRQANESLERRVEERAWELQQSEERYRRVSQMTSGIAYSCSSDEAGNFRIDWMTGAAQRITGYSIEEIKARGCWGFLVVAEDRSCFDDHITGLAPNTKDSCELRIRHKEGGTIWVASYAECISDPQTPGRLLLYGGLDDITERKQSEEALEESENRYRRIAEGLTDYLYTVRVEQGQATTTTHSAGCEVVTGYTAEDFAANPYLWFEMIVPEDREAARIQVKHILEGKENTSFEHRIIRKDGAVRWVSDTSILNKDAFGTLLSYDGVVKDITDHKHLEAQLHRSQKMESLGLLAGGVAHDMNNVLGAILGLASVHLELQPPGSPAHRAFTTITKACIRGGNLIESLLGFARHGLVDDQELHVNTLVQEEIRLLERTTLARVRLDMDLAPDLRPIRGDASALTHLLMNLCLNAVDAMPDNGTLLLRTRNLTGDWIEIVVEDTGCGMSKEVLEKALDPFFTTKEQGKGTGLGLSVAYSTVTAHRGQMEIQSEPGHGTRVLLRFPACTPEAALPVMASAPVAAPSPIRLKVLLVDDDELIQSSMQAIMEILGHAVTAARSGEEALAILEAGFQPDVVLLDMNMPGLGGAGTLPRLRALRPTVPVLLVTGRADQTALDLVEAHALVTLLSKPFGMKELQQQLEPLQRT